MPTTVILGVGIIGLSSAHSLASLAPPDHRIHLVEAAPKLFASASGKAAGFIAKDWFSPAISSLGVLSFDLHRELAGRYNGRTRWGYSESIAYSLDHTYQSDESGSDYDPRQEVAGVESGGGGEGESGLDWLLNGVSRATMAGAETDVAVAEAAGGPTTDAGIPQWLQAIPEALHAISDKRSTAQVHPRRLCEFLLEQCVVAGVILHHPARATQLLRSEEDPEGPTRVRIEYLGQQSDSPEGRARRVVDIPCENIVIAAGCWTPQVYATLFPNASRIPRITHLAGVSMSLKSRHWPPSDSDTASVAGFQGSTPCHAIFTDAAGFTPEIFSRATGDVWIGGLNPASIALPALPTDAQIDALDVERLLAVAHTLCGEDVEVRKTALCFRPVTATGRPIIARMHEADLGDGLRPAGVDGKGGVFVATGHGPWGISLSLGTGRVVAEMVLGRETSADVGALSRW
ncbi:nucleotide-binding domain-containing protein [Daedaleopsis nitida]|nr:nucleotide-binding domain-containing protein [Daedaleopsis nitida]